MATLKELRDERLRKLNELQKLGVNPYPSAVKRTHLANELKSDFASLEGQTVYVAGRVWRIRKFGSIAFLVVKDSSGEIQLFLQQSGVESLKAEQSQIGFGELRLLDSGDFIEAAGALIKTQTGEISVDVKRLRLIGKSLRPLPTPQEGLTNKEERLRRRYLDTNLNPEVYQRFIRRSRFWQSTRQFLLDRGFIEINVPVLEHTTGGADAKPFITHMDALDQDFYLRISHELPLKRLLGGGYEKVFDIGPRFRNENYSDEHLPEHVAMEWYWAYANWRDGMELTRELICQVAEDTWGKLEFKLGDRTINLSGDWGTVSFIDTLKKLYGIDPLNTSQDAVTKVLREHRLEVGKPSNLPRSIDKLWKSARAGIDGPVFLVDIPAYLQPLAKTQPGEPRLSEQFNVILGGTEACKAYSEQNHPIVQLQSFLSQQKMREAGDQEAQMLDIDFIEMLEYGMPPACGFGYSERLFWLLEGVTAREGVPFPQLRHETDSLTRLIYPDVKF